MEQKQIIHRNTLSFTLNFTILGVLRLSSFIIFFVVVNLSNCFSYFIDATTRDSTVYQVGKPMPNFEFDDIYKMPGAKINNISIKGKYVILDFWDISCTACIRSFSKLDSMQQIIGDELEIILVGRKDSGRNKEVLNVYDKYRSRLNLNLTSVADESIFSRLSIRAVPHLIWIDPQGIIRRISTGTDLTPKNMQLFLAGKLEPSDSRKDLVRVLAKNPAEAARVAMDIPKMFMLDDSTSGDYSGNALSMSAISKWNDGQPIYIAGGTRNIESKLENGRYRFQANGASAKTLYFHAIIGRYNFDYISTKFYLEPIYEYEDSVAFKTKFDNRTNYNYLLIRPRSIVTDSTIRRIMLKDLENYFNFTGRVETRMLPCLILKSGEKSEEKLRSKVNKKENTSNASKISLNYVSVENLINAMEFQIMDRKLQIINETGLSSSFKLDILLHILRNDSTDNFNKELQRYGLSLHEELRPQQAVVITEL